MDPHDPEPDDLLSRAGKGDRSAVQHLLSRHRDQLRRMVALRIDRRLVARVDPSDVVQEALAEAALNLSDYLRHRPLPFYPWLRRFAWERLVQLHRHHIHAQKRSVEREEPAAIPLPDQSAVALADRLLARGTSPSGNLMRDELHGRLQAALAELAPRHREILVLRYLEGLSTLETAAVLGISQGAVKMRHLRALEHLRGRLGDEREEHHP